MRIVLDTNVLLAGFISKGLCAALVGVCLESSEHVTVLSEHILREFGRCLESKFDVPAQRVRRYVQVLRTQVELVGPAPVPPESCRDPNDLPILGTALSGQADCLVTGDDDLLVLGRYQGCPILSPRQAYERLIAARQ